MPFRRSFTFILLASMLAVALGFARVPSAHAAQTLTVTDCTSDAQLQAAVGTANSDNAGDTITFACSGVIPLTKRLLIFGDMTLDGSGQSVTLDGGNKVEVLFVNDNNFTLNALTIAHGKTTSGGGGIENSGATVNINNSTFANNSAGVSGAIDNIGVVNINNSTFANNSSTTVGGGISGDGYVTISNSTFANNSAGSDGGGIYSNTVTISNSTFVNNSARYYGGGIDNDGGLTISNSTFANNSAGSDGGGIESINTASITNSTFANNSAVIGGAIEISGSTGSIGGSIVANNTGGNCSLPGASLTDQGYNLESGTDCGFTGTGSLQNTDPKLDPNGLQNNGGPTQTIALLSGSPASDYIPAANCPASDQRGITRPDDGETSCDIGAYESNYRPVDNDLGLTNMPANITTNATSPQGAVVSYTPPTATDESGDNPGPAVNCTPPSGSTFAIGTTTVTCTATDSDDTNSPVSGSFTVTVQPVFSVSVTNVNATEGSAFSGLVATGTAYGTSNPLSATINWGDGSSSTGSVTLNQDGSYSVSGSHTYAEEGSFALTVTVNDSGKLTVSGSSSATVADAALTLTYFLAGRLGPQSAGLAATFTDADPAGQVSDYTATIKWGDGTTSTVTIVKYQRGPGFALAGLHRYVKVGGYTVTLTVIDNGGSQLSKTTNVIVR